MFDLFGHRRPAGKLLFGLPGRGHLEGDTLLEFFASDRVERLRLKALDQRARQPLVLLQERAPYGLGRMSGKHGFDHDRAQSPRYVLRRRATTHEFAADCLKAAGLGFARAQVVDAPAQSVDLLGHVHDAEVGTESANHLEGLGGGQLAQLGGEGRPCGGITPAPLARHQAGGFDPLVDAGGSELPQEVPQECAQSPDIAAQRPVLEFESNRLCAAQDLIHVPISCGAPGRCESTCCRRRARLLPPQGKTPRPAGAGRGAEKPPPERELRRWGYSTQ